MVDEDKAKELTEALLRHGAVPVPGKATMYELKRSPGTDALIELLSNVRAFEGVTYLLPSDDPQQDAPQYAWEHAESGTWIMPDDVPADALLNGLLGPGAWRVYVAAKPAPVEDAPDLFRGPTIAALDFLERYGASVVVDAWHDNAEWRVAFLP